MAQPTILLSHYKVISWVYVGIIPILRKTLKARFILILPEGVNVPESFRLVLDSKDRIIHIPSLRDFISQKDGPPSSLKDSSEIETQYNCNLYQDVLLQERFIAVETMQGAPSNSHDSELLVSDKKLMRACEFYFGRFEKLFKNEEIILSLVWPRCAWEAVIGIISHYNEILVTYPYTSKGEGNLVYWADGMFANSFELMENFKEQKTTQAYNIERRTPPGRPDRFSHHKLSSYYGIKNTLKRVFLLFVNWSIFKLQDLRKLNLTVNRNLKELLKSEVKSYLYWKSFNKLCTPISELCMTQPFALYTFQNEPEFSVQGRCKEFFNQQAVILSIADSMPSGTILYIKEHAWVGHRTLGYYKDILKHPKIKMISPTVPASELVPKAKFVASLNGTVIFEASAFGVPAAFFSKRSEFSVLSNSFYFSDLVDLKHWVSGVMEENFYLDKTQSQISAQKYIDAVKSISFEGAPLYNQGSGKIDEEQLKKATRLLNNKLTLFDKNPKAFGFGLTKQ